MYLLKNRIKRTLGELQAVLDVKSRRIENMEIRRGKLNFPQDIQKISDGFTAFLYGDIWSEPEFDNYALFRFKVVIPQEYDGEKVILKVSTNQGGGHNMIRPQMLLFVDGTPMQGLDTNHERVMLAEKAKAGREYMIDVYAFSGMPVKTPYGDWVDLKEMEGVRFYADLQVRNDSLTEYYYNLKTPYTYLSFSEENSYEHQSILKVLCDSVNELDLRNPHSEEFYRGIKKANSILEKELYSKEYSGNGKATVIGHTHIDLAWLWQYKHTRDKTARSFSTAVKLLNEQKEHKFMSSQAQLYEFVKTEFPELYEEIKEMVKKGRWEPEGAMWVEPDMNLSAGESIVRQILYGKKFFKDEFDVDCKVLWLPDVFGYSAALPQILKKSGVEYFMTAKLGTNEVNRFPCDTFKWKGIDGEEVLAHLISYLPGVYNPKIEDGEILEGWRRYVQKDINDDVLVPFGFADGGGGPTEEQIEHIKRLKKGLPGVPQTKFGEVVDYFKRLEKKVQNDRRLPTWSGEIYYEKHRGTYTSMARNKKQNRKCEFLYMNAEWLWSLARIFGGGEFPKEKFDKGMKNMLLNQFHDVLPGSSIKQVYDDSDALYKEAFEIGEEICETAVRTIAKQMGAKKPSVLIFNPYGEKVSGYAETEKGIIFAENVPAKGFAVYALDTKSPQYPVTATETEMENEYWKLKLSENGFIEALYDKKAGRQCFKENAQANKLRIFEDRPELEDNWNLDSFYTEKEYELPMPDEIKVMETGGERGIVRIARKYQSSVITQDIIMYAHSKRIDFKTTIDWKEHSQIIRTDFPVDVNATKATYEIQFGHTERANNRNTSWEEAKFEVCGHKWADISDNGYGMALMNDCKYGYSALGGTIAMTLLRSGNVPNPLADKELHEFTYSILPHEGSFVEAEVVKEAYMLNNPMFAVTLAEKEASLPDSFSMFECEGAILETVKPAENGDGLILRMYEANNKSGRVKITCGKKTATAEFCDLMENKIGDCKIEKDLIEFNIKPFEIVTLRVK